MVSSQLLLIKQYAQNYSSVCPMWSSEVYVCPMWSSVVYVCLIITLPLGAPVTRCTPALPCPSLGRPWEASGTVVGCHGLGACSHTRHNFNSDNSIQNSYFKLLTDPYLALNRWYTCQYTTDFLCLWHNYTNASYPPAPFRGYHRQVSKDRPFCILVSS